MPNPNYTAVLFVLDSSGSMDHSKKHMQQALHLMLEQQARKLAGYLTVDVGYFDGAAYFGEQDADPMLINLGMFARGGTQIYDSTAKILTRFQDRLRVLPEKQQPGHVVVVIVTDGASSRANTTAGQNVGNQIAGLIQQGWDFAFLAADSQALDRVRVDMQLPADCGVYEKFNEKGIQKMADQLGEFISMSRSGQRGHF